MMNRGKGGKALGAAVLVGALWAGYPGTATADLVFLDAVDMQGTGLGTVSTVLTIHDNDGTEAGCVGRIAGCPGGTLNSTPSDPGRIIGGTLGGNESTGNSQTLTRSVGELGITSGSEIFVVFNPVEPQAADKVSIDLNTLRLVIYDASGNIEFDASLLAPMTNILATDAGTGNAGFLFGLTPTQAAEASLILSATDRIGLNAAVSNAQGGHETFFLLAGPGGQPPIAPIPEPTSVLLLGSGLAGLMTWMARKRRTTEPAKSAC